MKILNILKIIKSHFESDAISLSNKFINLDAEVNLDDPVDMEQENTTSKNCYITNSTVNCIYGEKKKINTTILCRIP